jgi:hypothetical protein
MSIPNAVPHNTIRGTRVSDLTRIMLCGLIFELHHSGGPAPPGRPACRVTALRRTRFRGYCTIGPACRAGFDCYRKQIGSFRGGSVPRLSQRCRHRFAPNRTLRRQASFCWRLMSAAAPMSTFALAEFRGRVARQCTVCSSDTCPEAGGVKQLEGGGAISSGLTIVFWRNMARSKVWRNSHYLPRISTPTGPRSGGRGGGSNRSQRNRCR